MERLTRHVVFKGLGGGSRFNLLVLTLPVRRPRRVCLHPCPSRMESEIVVIQLLSPNPASLPTPAALYIVCTVWMVM